MPLLGGLNVHEYRETHTERELRRRSVSFYFPSIKAKKEKFLTRNKTVRKTDDFTEIPAKLKSRYHLSPNLRS
ncbi:hypothetical protein QJS04_geneDACA001843 [Acorus gramineus]|uniref:Uncharacterized protein n=1 Tax=Acorus gramineus TaxID=55184 RepID=A0AAV9BJC2_ACOGR|nr:hypothetical protein QJS04_geneDACA001843 [Acorus gramineus]